VRTARSDIDAAGPYPSVKRGARGRCLTHGFRDLACTGAVREPPGEQRGRHRVEVGVAGEPGVQRFEPAGGRQQQRERLVAAIGREGDLRAHQVDTGAVGLAEGPRGDRGEECGRLLEAARGGLRPGGGDRPGDPALRVRRERHGSLQERGRGGQTAVCERAIGRALELGGDLLVGRDGGAGQVPGPAVGVPDRIRDIGERRVHRAPCGGRRGPVHGRADERMPEPHPIA
jgi:hypothetical protein